jgi:hypothetical protein
VPRAEAVGLLTAGAESDLHRQQADQHVVDPARNQPRRAQAIAAIGWTPLPAKRSWRYAARC